MRRVHVWASGLVQGVGFRFGVRSVATAARLSGWVRNCPDGRVEAELEGTELNVAAVLAWMRRGPAGARVDRLEVHELDPGAGAGAFVVLPTA
ncbi:acylphosphatase [Pseudactinotalea sp. HY160]|uniref:acylphosphatase n=1 Tax=Pseudactinotalea sp. HY160 TaxID=2654490 RepID=UPI00128BDDE4|nr:acylphosphatase [Pseudactinotalea sp. HY160]MPV51395.1 acylphosphatase [Pseudactinotalea sp. HY160]